MLGVFPVLEAVKLAQEKGFDLIEVVPNASPPTCKIMDYGKYKYEQKKKAHESKKKQIQVDIKELQFRPRTDVGDVDTKLKHARRFLENGDKVKFSMRFRGREIAYQATGEALMRRVLEALKDLAVVEAPPKMEGKQLFAMIGPDPIKLKEIRKKKAAARAAGEAEEPELEPLAPEVDDGEDDDEEGEAAT